MGGVIKMKKNIILKFIFITLILLFIGSNMLHVEAITTSNYSIGKLTRDEAKALFDMGDKLLGILLNIATIVSILTIAIIGVKIMFGSVDQKAEYKAALLPWLIGAIIVFSITRIIALFQSVAGSIGGG